MSKFLHDFIVKNREISKIIGSRSLREVPKPSNQETQNSVLTPGIWTLFKSAEIHIKLWGRAMGSYARAIFCVKKLVNSTDIFIIIYHAFYNYVGK